MRLLNGGLIDSFPRKFSDTELLMALAASSFNAEQLYSEKEVNNHLVSWLEGFTSPFNIDHVTVRRYLVDLRFLGRDSSGAAYWIDRVSHAMAILTTVSTLQTTTNGIK